jgi:hypothetical protein
MYRSVAHVINESAGKYIHSVCTCMHANYCAVSCVYVYAYVMVYASVANLAIESPSV